MKPPLQTIVIDVSKSAYGEAVLGEVFNSDLVTACAEGDKMLEAEAMRKWLEDHGQDADEIISDYILAQVHI